MAYDYSSENKRLELPNPYRVENQFLFACGAMLLIGGVLALLWARSALVGNAMRLGIAPLLVGIGLLASGIGFAMPAARRLRFFFGRGRPLSLAPEVPVGATGNSATADYYKTMLRQGGIEFKEPHGALNGLLYNAMPRLITAPVVVQEMAQRQFFNALSFLATLASFVFAWAFFGTDDSRPLISVVYFLFAAFVLLKPLARGNQVTMTTTSLIGLIVAAVVGPVLIGLVAKALPPLHVALHVQTFFLLTAALVAVALIMAAVFAQVDASPPTDRSCEQVTLSMNGPPGALVTELDRKLQNEWVEQIPNRRYTRLEPATEAAAGSGRFAGEVLEETQPMPLTGTVAPTLAGAFEAARHRWLVVLDVYATLLVAVGVICSLVYVHGFDPAQIAQEGWGPQAPVGYSVICLLVAAFCFQATAAIWGRFNFTSVLLWVELLGVWQTSRIGTGNQLSSRLHTDNDVVRIESMTLRVWRAQIETVVFGKDSARQVVGMHGTSREAKQLAAELIDFAQAQSVFIAPQASEDSRRLGALKASEALLGGEGAAPMAVLATTTATTTEAHEALRVDAVHRLSCPACGAPALSGAKFCTQCGQDLRAAPTVTGL